MKAVLCHQWGGPDSLTIEDIPTPVPGPGQVRIAVQAASVNFADTLIIEGKYQEKPAFPFSPGLEAAGIISAVGAGVTGLREGDRVMAVLGHGGFAEHAIAAAEAVQIIPASMPFDQAASFAVAYGTSHVALDHRGRLQSGETLLVHGAAGGVGLTAVQIGKVMGARVIATARGAEKLAIAREAGADHVIDYGTEDVRERVNAITEKRGANVIYDPVGGDIFDTSLRCIAWEGRLLVIGFAAGRIPSAPANYLLVKNCAAMGVFWGAYMRQNPGVIQQSLSTLLGWWEAGKLRPHISHQMPLSRFQDAMGLLTSRKSTGKVVINVAEA